MFIESIQPVNFGPFAFDDCITLEPDVTVLTGPNDVGKSSVLRLIHRVLTIGSTSPDESEINADNEHDSSEAWDTRKDFGAVIRVHLGDEDPLPPGTPRLVGRPTSYSARMCIAPKNPIRHILQLFLNDKPVHEFNSVPLRDNFQPVILPPESDIRNTIELASPNAVEQDLFRVALGNEFEFKNLAGSSANWFEAQLGRAEAKLNGLLRDLLPAPLGIAWKLRAAADRTAVHCNLTDAHGAYTPLGSRGSGVRKVMALLATLLQNQFDKGHWVVLFDEPEASLHADSQHLLRRLLEKLAARTNVQVVYATHSPSMINVARSHSVRLLRRESRGGKPTTAIDNSPFKANYLPVRSSLGLTPADSLLYAPVTVVVEGETEVVGLQLLLMKLGRENVHGFGRAETLLSQAHFLDGMGDQFSYACRMATSQGAKAVVFLDGDKGRHRNKFNIPDDVPVVVLDGDDEVEQLVPASVYFQALAEVVGDESSRVTVEAYQQWVASANLPSRMAFTKRVGRWLDSLDVPEPGKARVMRRAVELVDVGRVATDRLLELLTHIEGLLPQ
jgi:ABC-type transport system involved in cytochrome c biogenesis ATPase subunit